VPTDDIAKLSSPDPAVRDAAAAAIRKAIAANPSAAGDRGEAFWKAKLATIKLGITREQLDAILPNQGEGTMGGNSGETTNLRVDDYWTVSAHFDRSQLLRELSALTRSVRVVWVQPPAGFSGKWTGYFVNGIAARVIVYTAAGKYERFTSYYDNGQLTYEQRYVNGEIDGPELGFHRDGRSAYDIHHAAGKNAGHWVHWYPDGKMQSEERYKDGVLDGTSSNWRPDGTKSSRIDYRAGQETGQAAWDEQGKLIYARGSAENAR